MSYYIKLKVVIDSLYKLKQEVKLVYSLSKTKKTSQN